MSQQPKQGASPSYWGDLAFITLILGSLFFILLGSRPLFVPDEGRYAEIAREMAESGNYVTPYLNHIKYFEKPILFYWLGAAAIKVGGLNLWSIRSINALLGLLGCLFTYTAARQWYDRSTGILAALILGTSTLYFVMAHMVSLDLPVSVFLTCCLYAFLLGMQQPPGKRRRYYFWAAAATAALAVLMKGLIGLVFPILIIGVWLTVAKQWRRFTPFYPLSCLLIFFLIAAPWHILVGLNNPEFFYFYFIEQHFLRYTTMDIGHYQPVWFFLPALILGFFPWVMFLPQSIAASLSAWCKEQTAHQTDLFLLLWALLIFAFFSFSKSKLIPYILPVFPPLAILTGHYLSQCFNNARRLGIKIGYGCLLISSIALFYGFYFFTHHTTLPDATAATRLLSMVAGIIFAGSAVSYYFIDRDLFKSFVITIAMAWCFLLTLLAAMPAVDTRTILPLAAVIKPLLQPQDDVITYNQYYQDLPFYLERRITILNWKNELSYGMEYQDTHEWMINNDAFWRLWHSKKRVFVILSRDEYQGLLKLYPHEHIHVLAQTTTNVLICNHPLD